MWSTRSRSLLDSFAVDMPTEVAAEFTVGTDEGSGSDRVVVELPVEPVDFDLSALGVGDGDKAP